MTQESLRRWHSCLVGALSVIGSSLALAAEVPNTQDVFALVGHVQVARRVYVAATIPGTITKIHVDVGDVVKAGEVVAELDSSRGQLECERAQLRVEFTRAEARMVKAALGEGDRSSAQAKERIAAGELEVQLAENELRLAKHNLEATQLRAVSGGTILARHAEVGQAVVPERQGDFSNSLFEMADLNALEVGVQVPEGSADRVFQGQRCEIVARRISTRIFQGKVVRVRPTIDVNTATFLVQIQIETSDTRPLRPGNFVEIRFLPRE